MPFTFAQVLLHQWYKRLLLFFGFCLFCFLKRVFGAIMCPIVLFQQVFSVSLSIYTMVAIGIDR